MALASKCVIKASTQLSEKFISTRDIFDTITVTKSLGRTPAPTLVKLIASASRIESITAAAVSNDFKITGIHNYRFTANTVQPAGANLCSVTNLGVLTTINSLTESLPTTVVCSVSVTETDPINYTIGTSVASNTETFTFNPAQLTSIPVIAPVAALTFPQNRVTLSLSGITDSATLTTFVVDSALNSAICNVDRAGVVTATTAGSCSIFARVGKPGYTTKQSDAVLIVVNPGVFVGNLVVDTKSITWPNNKVNITSSGIADTGTKNLYSIDTGTDNSANCNVDAVGLLSAISIGVCTVTVSVTKNGYTTVSANALITILPGTLSDTVRFNALNIVWPATSASLAVTNIDTATTVSYRVDTSSVANSANCVINNSVLSIQGIGICSITATISKENYNTLTLTTQLTVSRGTLPANLMLNPINLTWPATSANLAIANIDETTTTVTYSVDTSVANNVNCVVNANFVNVANLGTCSVMATISRANYNTLTKTALVTVFKWRIFWWLYTDSS